MLLLFLILGKLLAIGSPEPQRTQTIHLGSTRQGHPGRGRGAGVTPLPSAETLRTLGGMMPPPRPGWGFAAAAASPAPSLLAPPRALSTSRAAAEQRGGTAALPGNSHAAGPPRGRGTLLRGKAGGWKAVPRRGPRPLRAGQEPSF